MVLEMNSLFHEGVQVKRTIIAGLAGLVIIGGLAEAKVYRWVDENGKVVYSQSPPPESIEAKEIQVNAPPPATPVEEKTENVVDEKVKGNPALDPALRKEYCKKGRQNLKVLEESDSDARFKTSDGQVVAFTAEERALKVKEAKAVIKAYCD